MSDPYRSAPETEPDREPEDVNSPEAEDLESIVAAEIEDAVTFADSEIGYERAEATRYYRGDPFGDEEEGRSQVVSRDVADTVNQILPSIVRTFFGPEKVVEFAPQGPADVAMAEQATDYVNYIFTRDNPGFEICFASFKDALIRKTGVVKYWWDDSKEVTTTKYTGLDENGLTKLMGDLQQAQEAEIIETDGSPDNLSVTIKLVRSRDRVCIEALPTEEFLIDRRARTIEDATFVAHRSMKTVSELVAMGYSREEVEELSQDGDDLRLNPQVVARNPYQLSFSASSLDPTMRLVLYVEAYVRSDQDGDGIAELWRVCSAGPGHKLLHKEPVEDRPFAAFHCDPEPHTFFGQSIADKTKDIQRIKSNLMRNTLDGLALAIHPRMVVGQGGKLEDAMNSEIGAILRADGPAGEAYYPLVTPDVTGSAYQALTYMDQVKESRTGMNRVSQGLDPSLLQNTTAVAASAQFTQSQQHIELIARIFAETGMKRLFRGILKLVVENQRKERLIQLRGQWVPIDPRNWRVDMEVVCNVALGGGTNAEKMGLLTTVIGKQEQIMKTLGPANPMVDLNKYHSALTQFLALGGFKNAESFFGEPGNYQPPQPPPPPEMVRAQGEAQAAQARAQTEQTKAQTEQARAATEAQRLELDGRRLDLDHERLNLDAEERAARLALERETAEKKQALAERELSLNMGLRVAETNARLAEAHTKGRAQVDVATIRAHADRFRTEASLAIQASESHDAHIMQDEHDQDPAADRDADPEPPGPGPSRGRRG